MSGKYTGGRTHVAKGEEGGKKIVLVTSRKEGKTPKT